MVLSVEEVAHMREGGSDIQEVLGEFIVREKETRRVVYDVRAEVLQLLLNQYKDEPGMREHVLEIGTTLSMLDDNEEYHQLNGRCGYLGEDNLCTAYDKRPDVCRRFEVGTKACTRMRDRAGISTPVELRTKAGSLCLTSVVD
jgi:Fe-S-cluster containining protein